MAKEKFIETRGEHNIITSFLREILTSLKNVKDLSNINTPIVAVTAAIQSDEIYRKR